MQGTLLAAKAEAGKLNLPKVKIVSICLPKKDFLDGLPVYNIDLNSHLERKAR